MKIFHTFIIIISSLILQSCDSRISSDKTKCTVSFDYRIKEIVEMPEEDIHYEFDTSRRLNRYEIEFVKKLLEVKRMSYIEYSDSSKILIERSFDLCDVDYLVFIESELSKHLGDTMVYELRW